MKKHDNSIENLVSIIMPTYNSEMYIKKSINSVLRQTYKNWELIIVDDCSTDTTKKIIRSINDERIKLFELTKNQGAAVARNTGLKKARGEFIAFLDSDDLWKPEKLTLQVKYMKKNNYKFTSTNYEEIDEHGDKTGKVIEAKDKLDYNGVLKYCPGNSTVVYNARELGIFFIPNIRKRNDFVMWLQVIKKAKCLYGINENLTQYRVRANSLSINKKSLIKYQWKVYREIEELSILKSMYLLIHKIGNILSR